MVTPTCSSLALFQCFLLPGLLSLTINTHLRTGGFGARLPMGAGALWQGWVSGVTFLCSCLSCYLAFCLCFFSGVNFSSSQYCLLFSGLSSSHFPCLYSIFLHSP